MGMKIRIVLHYAFFVLYLTLWCADLVLNKGELAEDSKGLMLLWVALGVLLCKWLALLIDDRVWKDEKTP